MKIVDAHCHLDAKELPGAIGEVLAQAAAAGVAKLVTNAVTPEGWAPVRQLAHEHAPVAFAWGVHPWFVEERHIEHMDALGEAKRQGAVAIGEIGLDAKIEQPAMALQERLFIAQLEVATAVGLPVTIHCRGAFNELLRILRDVGAPERGGIVHAFSGSAEVAEALIKHGLAFSMGASLTYKKSRKRMAVLERIYPDHLLLETDSPDMPPVQAHGQPNVPANIRFCLSGAAELLGESKERVAEVTTKNAVRIFGLELD